jgi:hypothetical protein
MGKRNRSPVKAELKPDTLKPPVAKRAKQASTDHLVEESMSTDLRLPWGVNPVPDSLVDHLTTTVSNGQVKMPFHAFVNHCAARLFRDVNVRHLLKTRLTRQNFLEFQTVSTVFWLSFFLNQRGLEEKLILPFLDQLVSDSKSRFYKSSDPNWQDEFSRIHKVIKDWFVSKMNSFVEEWMVTAAAVEFKENRETAK